MSDKQPFGKDYYDNGPASGLSNYVDYRWLGAPTIAACKRMAEYIGARPGDSIMDVGAAKGYYVRGFRESGFRAFGYDTSTWAVENCDETVREWMFKELPERAFDWIILKDICEHVRHCELAYLVGKLSLMASKGMLVIVPLAKETGGAYLREEDERDSTHVIRWTLIDWIRFLESNAHGFNVNASFHIEGIKPASRAVPHSTGFFTLFRP